MSEHEDTWKIRQPQQKNTGSTAHPRGKSPSIFRNNEKWKKRSTRGKRIEIQPRNEWNVTSKVYCTQKCLKLGTFNDLFQLIIYKFINYQSTWCSVHSAHKSTSPPRCPGRSSRWCFLTATTWRPQSYCGWKMEPKQRSRPRSIFWSLSSAHLWRQEVISSRMFWGGKRVHGMGNGTVVLKHNANLKVYIQSQHLFVTASLSIYVWYNKNHASIHYWSQQLVLKLGPKMDPSPCYGNPSSLHHPTNQRKPTNPRPPSLAWKKRRSNNSISCKKVHHKQKLVHCLEAFQEIFMIFENLSGEISIYQ